MFIMDTQSHPIGLMDVDHYPASQPDSIPPPTLAEIPTPYGRPALGPRDWDVDEMIAEMDQHGISKAVVMCGSIQVTNDNLAEAVRLYPDRLLAFASYEHYQPDSLDAATTGKAVAAMERGIAQLGFKGIGEIHWDRFSPTPPDQMYIEVRPILEVCRKYRVPVYFHMSVEPLTHRIRRVGEEGSSWKYHPAPLPYRDPVYLDAVAIEYPDVPILVGHMGGRFRRHFEGALMLALRHRNVYLTTVNAPAEHIAEAVREVGAERIVWGSDWARHRRWHAANLAALEQAGLSPAQKEAILGRNLADLLGIPVP